MAVQITTLAETPNENKTFYNRHLISRLLPSLVFAKYGQRKPIPKNQGDTVNFRKFNPLTPPTKPLTEGVTPDGQKMSVTQITATAKQYGDFVTVTDKLDMIGIDPVITEAVGLIGEEGGQTIDTVVRDIVVAGTNVQYVGGGTNTDSVAASNKLTSEEISRAVRTLRKANAKSFDGKYFVGVIDPETAYDLMRDPLWQDVSKYNGGTAILDGEVGKIAGVRFIETTEVKKSTNTGGVEVHSTMIIGKDAYGVVDIGNNAKGKPQVIIKGLGSAGTDDPLDQRATVGWKALFTAIRLNELAMLRVEHAVSE